jgi:hypothetical protein
VSGEDDVIEFFLSIFGGDEDLPISSHNSSYRSLDTDSLFLDFLDDGIDV